MPCIYNCDKKLDVDEVQMYFTKRLWRFYTEKRQEFTDLMNGTRSRSQKHKKTPNFLSFGKVCLRILDIRGNWESRFSELLKADDPQEVLDEYDRLMKHKKATGLLEQLDEGAFDSMVHTHTHTHTHTHIHDHRPRTQPSHAHSSTQQATTIQLYPSP